MAMGELDTFLNKFTTSRAMIGIAILFAIIRISGGFMCCPEKIIPKTID